MSDGGISGSLIIPLRGGRLLNERDALRTVLTMIMERERAEGGNKGSMLQTIEKVSGDIAATVWRGAAPNPHSWVDSITKQDT